MNRARNFGFERVSSKNACTGVHGDLGFFCPTFVAACLEFRGVERLAVMEMRAFKYLGENRAPLLGTLRNFTASRNLWVAGAPGKGTEGTQEMDSGEQQLVTEVLESPYNRKQYGEDGETDSAEEEPQGKPVAQVGIEKVRENLAGCSS